MSITAFPVLARVIQEHIKKPLADEVLFGHLKNGGHVRVIVDKDENGRDKLGFEYLDGPITPKPEKLPVVRAKAKRRSPDSRRPLPAQTLPMLSPVAALESPVMTLLAPGTGNPDGAAMRRTQPAAIRPEPASATPIPVAFRPDKSRSRSVPHDSVAGRGRRTEPHSRVPVTDSTSRQEWCPELRRLTAASFSFRYLLTGQTHHRQGALRSLKSY